MKLYPHGGMETEIRQLAGRLRDAQYAVALTGAGVSTESGIPDFRSPDSGLWARADPEVVASVEGFQRDPEGFYEFWTWRFPKLKDAQPNATHRLLAELERQGMIQAVITQNIDGLHRDAGSQTVREVHGTYRQGVCVACGHLVPIEAVFEQVQSGGLPYCKRCDGLIKPDVVLFGEMLPEAFLDAQADAERADLLLALGSSLEVHPVAGLVPRAQGSGARVAIANRDPTPYDDLADVVIHDDLGPVVDQLADALGIPLAPSDGP
ncbi:MAG: NAD-dependent deacetylase [Candidatus Bipolaricaulia bacterium]